MGKTRRVALALASAGALTLGVAAPATAAPAECTFYPICVWPAADFGGEPYEFDLRDNICYVAGPPNNQGVVSARNEAPFAVQFWSNYDCTGETAIVANGGETGNLGFVAFSKRRI
ncbi:peptidase inhibitor family I36 protein [Saccharopolyspora taberi]|uniref:Peptidase inhibitor family I36 n=1 Tax=Saccharopolyspora taberi TaxID=60895 RepID=A0ABN3VPK2_9PSEU